MNQLLKDALIGVALGLLLFMIALACELRSFLREVAAAQIECSAVTSAR